MASKKNRAEKKMVSVLENIEARMVKINKQVDKMNPAGYTALLQSPRRMMLMNFLGGLARGFGFAVGATLLGALFLGVLFRLADLNLPVIGEFVARLVRIVQTHL